MKLKKDQFKVILKECILELIDEGAFDKVLAESLHASPRVAANGLMTSHPQVPQNPYQQNRQPQSRPDYSYNHVGQGSPNQRLQEISKITAQMASGGDPRQASMLANIFEDTARTTLQEQLGQGGGGGNMYVGEQSSPEQDAADRAQLEALSNGMGASRWAAVAFANLGKKK
jgi:hypothetical protein